MRDLGLFIIFGVCFSITTSYMGIWEQVESVAQSVHKYEYKYLALVKEHHILKNKHLTLKNKYTELNAKNEHLAMSNSQKLKRMRSIASIHSIDSNNLVQFDLYKWSPSKLLDIGEQSYKYKKYEKSAQFYNALIHHYKEDKNITAQVLFNAGVASFESKNHYDWAMEYFSQVIKQYPGSKLQRGAKLWLALTYQKSGMNDKFIDSVEEFRLKYRNTNEWKVLSRYYEDIANKYKK
ncbi:MAG: hypothetical protein N4A33_01290 [Bacteriovoracaceae bacterium]|jgi:outer membrane protein assembly factor BamD (BamD/ComL family)|nr:hypothetical protein [Bacteriovoracaceae bacterium]